MGSAPPVLGATVLGSFLRLRGGACLDFLLLLLNFANFGLLPSLRGYSVVGSALPVLDPAAFGSSPFARGKLEVQTFQVVNEVNFGLPLSVKRWVNVGPALLIVGFARFDNCSLALDFLHPGFLLLLQGSSRLNLSISILGPSALDLSLLPHGCS